jgi:DNA-binding response OmpR family regulator
MQSAGSAKPVILVVDDNIGVANSLRLLLQHSGYMPVVVHTGKAALDSLSPVTKLAIIAIQLADMDGVTVAVKARARVPECKILLVSGYPESTPLIERAKESGMHFCVLAKPIAPRELLSTIAALLQERRSPAA